MSGFLDFVNSQNKTTPTTSSGGSLLQQAQQSADPRDAMTTPAQAAPATPVGKFVSDPTVVNPPSPMQKINGVTKDIGTGLISALAGSGADALNKGTSVGPGANIKNLIPGLLNPKTYLKTIGDIGNIIKGFGQSGVSDALAIPQAVANTGVGFAQELGGNIMDLIQGKPVAPHSALTAGIDEAMKNPDKGQAFAGIISHTLNQIAPYLIAGEGTSELPNDTTSILDQANKATNVAVNNIPGVKNIPGAQDLVNKGSNFINDTLQNKYVNQVKSEWAKPTTVSNKTFAKANDIYTQAAAKGNDISQILTGNKLNPADHIVDGNYSTSASADQIRADAGKMSNDLLRPSLQMADYSTPKTSVQDIVDKTIADIKASKTSTAGDMKTQIAKVKTEGEALAAKHPDGMSLTDMHDNNIRYNLNGKFSPVNDTTVNNTAAVNRAFARSLDSTLQEKVPEGIPFKAFKGELQKQYQAADYLDALDGKKAPITAMQSLRKTAGKVVGASAGASLGGGVLGGVGGYHIGGMVESMLENMPNPIRNSFLNNLQITNPTAFSVISEYLKQGLIDQTQTLALPPATTIVPPTPEQNILNDQNALPNKGGTSELKSAEPQLYRSKTGQIRKGFKSTSK